MKGSYPYILLVLSVWTIAAISHVTSSYQRDNPVGSDIRPEDAIKARWAKRRKSSRKSEKPNIVIILTDDQDSELGSLNYMPKTLKILRDGGATFKNAFVTTPMCCPSRSSFLTGQYVHNHNTYSNNDNCSSINWQQKYEINNFGTYLSNAGYRTGYFGKYLNEYNGTYIPPGWREWVGLIRNSRFYNYSINFNGRVIKHEDNYYKDYLTDLIANDSVTFLKQSKEFFPNRPVAMVLSMPAPHGPEDSAPQYQHMFQNNTAHRTPNWNFAPNPDKQWILQVTGKMEPIHIAFTDMLQQKRLQTLQSVDDAVQKVFQELRNLGEVDNTYIIFTSDHGYHLGQFGLLKGKAMPYEMDVRVPFMIRGPGIPHGITIPNIVINLDIAPTVIDIAGVPVPEHMDGRSIMDLLQMARDPTNLYNGVMKRKKAWRDTFLLERGKLTMKKLKERERQEVTQMNAISSKELRLKEQCAKPEFQSPCKIDQKWECRVGELNRLRIYKCRFGQKANTDKTASEVCQCPPKGAGKKKFMRRKKRRNNRRFVHDEASRHGFRQAQYRQFQTHRKRSIFAPSKRRFLKVVGVPEKEMTLSHVFKRAAPDGFEWRKAFKNYVQDEPASESASPEPTPDSVLKKCRVLADDTVSCQEEVFTDYDKWRVHKEELNKIIQGYRKRLDSLKYIRRHLKKQRPLEPLTTTTTTTMTTTTTTTTATTTAPPTTTTTLSLQDLATYSPNNYEDEYDDLEETDDLEVDPNDPDACVCPEDDEEDNAVEREKARQERIERRKIRRSRRKMTKMERGGKNGRKKGRKRGKEPCKESSMKCFTMENDHWRTAPKWKSRQDPHCDVKGVECRRMDNEHWKTKPQWRLGPFCFCANANNNTYWCLRTINDTHNFLYCEFITGFISYYDLLKDPYQLQNAVRDLDFGIRLKLRVQLDKLKKCSGAKECTVRSRGPDTGLEEDDSSGGQKGAGISSPNRPSLVIPDFVKNFGTRKSESERERGSGRMNLNEDDLLVAG